jgi:Mg2+-importing ATPase
MGRWSIWLSWLLGIAVLGAVIAAALHLSEGRDFIDLVEHASPWWLLAAALLQTGTYIAQGEVWRRVGARAGVALSARDAFGLSLAKLFADQALPSAGISGSVVVAQILERRHVPREAAGAAVVINLASYHLGYIVALTAALAILEWDGHATFLIVLCALAFVVFAVAVASGVMVMSGASSPRWAARIGRFKPFRGSVEFILQSDARLVRDPRLVTAATVLQVCIIVLDSTTMYALLRSVGASPAVTGVFASFMIASLVRTIGIVPGGLGTFEATSVFTLTATGTAIPVALSATLLFRGLSFWLPMMPGLWFSRRLIAKSDEQPRNESAGVRHRRV